MTALLWVLAIVLLVWGPVVLLGYRLKQQTGEIVAHRRAERAEELYEEDVPC